MEVKSMTVKDDKRVELVISVGAQEFAAAVDAAFKKNSVKMSVPGFRRGKAPRKMIEKLYGEGVFYEEAVNNTYPTAYDAAITEKAIEPVERAEIEVMEVGADGYSFKATFSVKPEVTLGDYRGIKIDRVVTEATDADVDAQLERERERIARVIEVEGRAAQNSDTAVINFDGYADGVQFEGGKGESYPLELGSGSFIPGFEEQVVGHNVGDSFDVSVTFPENYHEESLKGKAVIFKCDLLELKTKELPELDDELAKDISEFDTLAELRTDIKKKMQEHNDEHSSGDAENKLMESVCGMMTAEIPQCMYEERIDDLLREFEYRLQSQGLNLETYLGYTGMDMEGFRKSFAEQAEAQVKTRLALEKIVDQEKIEATEQELEEEYAKVAKSYGMEADKVKSILPPSEIGRNIAMNKAIDLVRESAVITDIQGEAK